MNPQRVLPIFSQGDEPASPRKAGHVLRETRNMPMFIGAIAARIGGAQRC